MPVNEPSMERLLKLSMLPASAPSPSDLRALTRQLPKWTLDDHLEIPDSMECRLREDKPSAFPDRAALLSCVPVLRDGLVVMDEAQEE